MTLSVIVTKDGKKISEAMSPDKAFAFVLKHQGQSYEYAMKHGGYSLEIQKGKK
jgi:hypothetical protein